MRLSKYAAILLISVSSYVYAQVTPAEKITVDLPCYKSKEIFKELAQTYQEIPLAAGKANDQAKSIMTLWVNNVNRSWTILATKDDTSCVVGVGTNFEVITYTKGKTT